MGECAFSHGVHGLSRCFRLKRGDVEKVWKTAFSILSKAARHTPRRYMETGRGGGENGHNAGLHQTIPQLPSSPSAGQCGHVGQRHRARRNGMQRDAPQPSGLAARILAAGDVADGEGCALVAGCGVRGPVRLSWTRRAVASSMADRDGGERGHNAGLHQTIPQLPSSPSAGTSARGTGHGETGCSGTCRSRPASSPPGALPTVAGGFSLSTNRGTR